MPNQWIEYVKHYQQTHNISYKEALKLASDTYKINTVISGGSGSSRVEQPVEQPVEVPVEQPVELTKSRKLKPKPKPKKKH